MIMFVGVAFLVPVMHPKPKIIKFSIKIVFLYIALAIMRVITRLWQKVSTEADKGISIYSLQPL